MISEHKDVVWVSRDLALRYMEELDDGFRYYSVDGIEFYLGRSPTYNGKWGIYKERKKKEK